MVVPACECEYALGLGYEADSDWARIGFGVQLYCMQEFIYCHVLLTGPRTLGVSPAVQTLSF
jgi:hypothetical protein